jgi:hypothetical protein
VATFGGGRRVAGRRSRFLVQVDDMTACPQTGVVRHGNSFELFLLNGHAHGATAPRRTS